MWLHRREDAREGHTELVGPAAGLRRVVRQHGAQVAGHIEVADAVRGGRHGVVIALVHEAAEALHAVDSENVHDDDQHTADVLQPPK